MNLRLLLGGLLLVLIVVTAIIGPVLAPYNLDYSKKIITVETDAGLSVYGAPFPPSRENLLGTDQWGYDILTLLLYGARYSVFSILVVSFGRVGLGGLVGLLLGINSTKVKPLNISAIGGVPTFLIIYFCMFGISINSTLSSLRLAAVQVALLTILGIPGVASVISDKTTQIQKQQFVLAARTYGAGKLRLAIKHVLPILKENLVIMTVQEAISTLNILGQLGIFNLFLGGTIFTPNPMLFHSTTHEWAGLVGQSRAYIASSQWILVFPLLAFILILIALYIFSRGLEEYYKGKYQPYAHA